MTFQLDGKEYQYNKPVEGICFYVFIAYSPAHKIGKREIAKNQANVAQTSPFGTLQEALDVAEVLALKTAKRCKGGNFRMLTEDDDSNDNSHIHVFDGKNELIAKLGIIADDYRSETIH